MEIEKEVIDCVNDLVNKVVKKEYHRKWRENNKDKTKEYRENNKEYQKQWRQDNKQKKRVINQEYREKNKDKIKEYRQTPQCKKSSRIAKWKYHGIITDDYDALYDHYTKTAYCDICRVELTYDRHNTATTKCCDHDHTITDRPNFRNILCNACNIKRG